MIRSFVRRTGRISKAQQYALDTLSAQFLLPSHTITLPPDHFLNWSLIFQRKAPHIVEIGFGMGEASAYIAHSMPHIDFLCIDVHTPGIGALLQKIEQQQLRNIRIIQADAVDVFRQLLAPDSLEGIHIFFPDPWPKSRHHKRRLIRTENIPLLVSRLKIGAYLHCTTDWQSYAQQMLEVLSQSPLLKNTAHTYTEKPYYRPTTKFEARGIRLGHHVWDLIFKRVA